MNIPSLILGIIILGYGLFTIIIRIRHPNDFAQMTAIKKFWGQKLGSLIHITFYTIVPVLVGILFIFFGFHGISLF